MVEEHWLIGKRIVVEEQKGEKRAGYGKFIIKNLSEKLLGEFGNGYSIQSLKNFRQFYQVFSDLPIGSTVWSQSGADKSSTLWSRLSWSHYKIIMRVSSPEARNYYIKETAENSWAVRTLERNVSTQYYERILLSHSTGPVKKEMWEKTKEFQLDKKEFIKSPTVLEFLNLPSNIGYTECELEKAIINNLHHFLLELGKGYAFVERQQLIRTDARDYYIDLVFYNYILKGNEQIFASKYKLYLPTEEELRAEIEREKLNFKLQMRDINE